MHRCLQTIFGGILRCHFTKILHIMCPPQRGFRLHLLSNYSSTNNKLPCSPFSQLLHTQLKRGFLYSCFHFLHFCFPRNMMFCDHIFHIFFTCHWRNFPCVAFFLQGLVLEPYLLSLVSLVSLVSCFLPTMLFRTKKYIFWGPFMPSLIYWNWKRLSQVYIIQVRHKKRVPSFNHYPFNVSSWSYWTSNLSYIVHWNIYQGLGLCPWYWNCSICLSLHWLFLAFHMAPHTCAFHDSCAFSLHFLTNPKGISTSVIISKHLSLMFPS